MRARLVRPAAQPEDEAQPSGHHGPPAGEVHRAPLGRDRLVGQALSTKADLGPDEITAPIGAGGMGEVYKARDTRLGRTVAMKVLPAGVAADAERRRRFKHARAVSALNHPNICTLHDIGREGDTDFLVMEYLDGQTLAQRLAKGPLPLQQDLEYGIQIADALDKAHHQGSREAGPYLHRSAEEARMVCVE